MAIYKYRYGILLLMAIVPLSSGRGRMVEPPQRSSLWRHEEWYGKPMVATNTDDAGLNCGGYWKLHEINSHRCGLCGDPYDVKERPNEAGGRFAQGYIVRTYYQDEKLINVTIDVKASIGGYFEFRICPNNDYTRKITQECLDKYPLVISGHGRRFYADRDGTFNLQVKIPEDLTCTQCVLQWKWKGSYYWGMCDDGYGGIGCGDQEEYYNCADIAILPSNSSVNMTTTTESYTTGSSFWDPETTTNPSTDKTTTASWDGIGVPISTPAWLQDLLLVASQMDSPSKSEATRLTTESNTQNVNTEGKSAIPVLKLDNASETLIPIHNITNLNKTDMYTEVTYDIEHVQNMSVDTMRGVTSRNKEETTSTKPLEREWPTQSSAISPPIAEIFTNDQNTNTKDPPVPNGLPISDIFLRSDISQNDTFWDTKPSERTEALWQTGSSSNTDGTQTYWAVSSLAEKDASGKQFNEGIPIVPSNIKPTIRLEDTQKSHIGVTTTPVVTASASLPLEVFNKDTVTSQPTDMGVLQQHILSTQNDSNFSNATISMINDTDNYYIDPSVKVDISTKVNLEGGIINTAQPSLVDNESVNMNAVSPTNMATFAPLVISTDAIISDAYKDITLPITQASLFKNDETTPIPNTPTSRSFLNDSLEIENATIKQITATNLPSTFTEFVSTETQSSSYAHVGNMPSTSTAASLQETTFQNRFLDSSIARTNEPIPTGSEFAVTTPATELQMEPMYPNREQMQISLHVDSMYNAQTSTYWPTDNLTPNQLPSDTENITLSQNNTTQSNLEFYNHVTPNMSNDSNATSKLGNTEPQLLDATLNATFSEDAMVNESIQTEGSIQNIRPTEFQTEPLTSNSVNSPINVKTIADGIIPIFDTTTLDTGIFNAAEPAVGSDKRNTARNLYSNTENVFSIQSKSENTFSMRNSGINLPIVEAPQPKASLQSGNVLLGNTLAGESNNTYSLEPHTSGDIQNSVLLQSSKQEKYVRSHENSNVGNVADANEKIPANVISMSDLFMEQYNQSDTSFMQNSGLSFQGKGKEWHHEQILPTAGVINTPNDLSHDPDMVLKQGRISNDNITDQNTNVENPGQTEELSSTKHFMEAVKRVGIPLSHMNKDIGDFMSGGSPVISGLDFVNTDLGAERGNITMTSSVGNKLIKEKKTGPNSNGGLSRTSSDQGSVQTGQTYLQEGILPLQQLTAGGNAISNSGLSDLIKASRFTAENRDRVGGGTFAMNPPPNVPEALNMRPQTFQNEVANNVKLVRNNQV